MQTVFSVLGMFGLQRSPYNNKITDNISHPRTFNLLVALEITELEPRAARYVGSSASPRRVPGKLQRFEAPGGGAGKIGKLLIRDEPQARQALR